MGGASTRSAVGGGQTVKSVKLSPKWESIIASAQTARHFNARSWTAKEDAFLLRARKAGVHMDVIAKEIGVSQTTALRRWRELSGKGK